MIRIGIYGYGNLARGVEAAIKVNDDIIDYELIDEAFIGFYLNKGFYNIEITKQKSWLAETLISFFCTKFSEKPWNNHGKFG